MFAIPHAYKSLHPYLLARENFRRFATFLKHLEQKLQEAKAERSYDPYIDPLTDDQRAYARAIAEL